MAAGTRLSQAANLVAVIGLYPLINCILVICFFFFARLIRPFLVQEKKKNTPRTNIY